MSLLLDALRKNETPESVSSGVPEISYPRLATPLTASPNPQEINARRAAGGNLFTSKEPPRGKRFLLASVFITAGILAAGYGYYLHLEISAPAQGISHNAPPPNSPSSAIPAAIATPHPVARAAAPRQQATPSPTAPGPVAQDSAPPRVEQTEAHNATTTQSVSIQSQQESENIDLLLSSAYAAYQKGDYTTAWQRYGEVLTQVPNNRDALLGRAVIAQQQEKDDTALSYYRQVLLLDPRDPVAHAGLSRFDGNSLASRESRLKQLIAQQPDSAALHFALGHQYADQSRWSDAQQAYFNALAMEPSNPLFAFNLAICLDHLGQRKAAAKYYQQALQFSNAGSSGINRAKAQQRLDELNVAND